MNSPSSGWFVFGLLAVLVLATNVSCTSSSTLKAESWEVMVQYPVHHYYSGPIAQRIFQLSPDGKKLASLESHGDFINLVITDLASGTRQLATNFDDVMVTGYTWANDERLLFYTSDELAIYAVDSNGSNGRNLANTTVVCKDECLATEEPVFLVNYVQVMSRLPAKLDRVLVSSNHENILRAGLYELNVNTGNLNPVEPGGDSPEIYQWPVDGEGRILQAGIESDEVVSILQFNTTSGKWSETPAGDDTFPAIAKAGILSHLVKLQRELGVEDIRISSMDDNQLNAVLTAKSGQSAPDYYLYSFADESISLLASSPVEIAMIEENPSRIRVELMVVDHSYQRHPTMVTTTPKPYLVKFRHPDEIAARRSNAGRN